MAHGFVQVPPQSTGKKVATEERTEISYDNGVGFFNDGDVVIGATSGATGTVTAATSNSNVAGDLYLRDVSGTFIDNEDLQVNASTVAKANFTTYSQTNYALQKVIVTDPDNIAFNQKIDRFGATLNTFSDGSPVFGSFGSMSVGEPFASRTYVWQYANMNSLFWDRIVGGGTTSFESQLSATRLATTTASGDKITRTSNFYHPYSPGVGNEILISLQAGDTGKNNLVRRWGMFDDYNGLFWQLSGTTLSIVVRSDVTGSVVDTVVNQSSFNFDRLDGSDGLNFTLDLTAGNIFWIDYQWLGTGRARFGVYEPGGAKLVAHVVENANSTDSPYPYMATGTLPFRLEQENVGATISSSEMRCTCAVVRHSSKVILDGFRHANDSGVRTALTASGEVPIFSVRMKALYGTKINRGFFKGRSVQLTNLGNETVKFRVRGGTVANLTGASFVSQSAVASTEVDKSATAINTTGTIVNLTYVVRPNSDIFVQNIFDDDEHAFELFNLADGTTQPCFIVTAETLTGTTTDVIVSVNWEESKG